MTRKRFVKLLMAKGRSRNDANAIAEIARKKGVSYQTAINAVHPALAVAKIADAIRGITEDWCDMISHGAEALSRGITAFVETFNDAMQKSKGE